MNEVCPICGYVTAPQQGSSPAQGTYHCPHCGYSWSGTNHGGPMSPRVQNYAVKMSAASAGLAAKLTLLKPLISDVLTGSNGSFAKKQAIEQLVQSALANPPIGCTGTCGPVYAASYQAMAMEMWRAQTRYASGPLFDTMMSSIIAKWTMRGCDANMGANIAQLAFAWVLPPLGESAKAKSKHAA